MRVVTIERKLLGAVCVLCFAAPALAEAPLKVGEKFALDVDSAKAGGDLAAELTPTSLGKNLLGLTDLIS